MQVCTVAPVPGETKVWQYVTLMKRVYLIDCPGVVYSESRDTDAATVLKGVVRLERLEDATVFVPELLAQVKHAHLVRFAIADLDVQAIAAVCITRVMVSATVSLAACVR